jgi:hypothetical protein
MGGSHLDSIGHGIAFAAGMIGTFSVTPAAVLWVWVWTSCSIKALLGEPANGRLGRRPLSLAVAACALLFFALTIPNLFSRLLPL